MDAIFAFIVENALHRQGACSLFCCFRRHQGNKGAILRPCIMVHLFQGQCGKLSAYINTCVQIIDIAHLLTIFNTTAAFGKMPGRMQNCLEAARFLVNVKGMRNGCRLCHGQHTFSHCCPRIRNTPLLEVHRAEQSNGELQRYCFTIAIHNHAGTSYNSILCNGTASIRRNNIQIGACCTVPNFRIGCISQVHGN